jgi:O-antigen ligase/tetratricopeptide (TPR) repeat protein
MACSHGNLQLERTQSARGIPVSRRRAPFVMLVAQAMLAAVAIVTPWLFGGVQLRDQPWLFLAVGAALSLAAVGSWFTASTALPLAVLPLLAGVVLGAIQLAPLRPATLAAISPAAARLRAELTPTAPGSEAPAPRAPLSLYPSATRRELAMTVLAVATFVAGSMAFASPRGGLALCVAMAVAGGLLSFFEIAQHLVSTSAWRLGWSDAGRAFGPFINRNNAAGYLNLCLGGALGMVVWAVSKTENSTQLSWGPSSRWRRALLTPFAHLNATVLASLGLAACVMAGVLCTLSRGGGLAMACAALLTLAVGCAARFSPLRVVALGLVLLGGMAIIGWVGMTGPLQARFATLLDRAQLVQNRIPHWRDGIQAAGDFWRAGSGLGTYRLVYPLYQRRLDEGRYIHAENQYLEALVDAGAAGLVLILVMIATVAIAAWRLLRYSGQAGGVALGVAGVFALASQVLHGAVDFGLYIPANMLLFALVCGAVLGAAAALGRRLGTPCPVPVWVHHGSCGVALLLVAPIVWGAHEIHAAAAVDGAVRSTRFLTAGSPGSAELVGRGIDELSRVLAARPDDAEGQQSLAELWLARYRAEAQDEFRKELPAAGAPRWAELSSTFTLHERAHQFRRNGWADKLATLVNQPAVRHSLPQARECAWAAARACPLLVDAHLVLARLTLISGDASQDELHLARARRVMPASPEVLFRCGLLELQAGRPEQASCDWRRALELGCRHTEEILRRIEERMSLPYLVDKVLPDRPALLIDLARYRYAGARQDYARQLIAERCQRALDRVRLPADEGHYLRGAACRLQSRTAEAIREYEQAVALRPRDTEWRYELALLLKTEGHLAQAHEHACLCAAIAPRNGVYRGLLEQINHARLTSNPELKRK